ncbi:MAG TPA: alpha-L-fucosidase [Chitinophagaceae bacterium]|nr:alpha-L-fucosidase [Chitinophagaceae bacterium]
MRPALLILSLLTASSVFGQHAKYTPPSDPLVRKNIEHWQDLRFGLFMHWGTYSQWGIVESWSICPEDEGWTQRQGPYAKNYTEYVKAYEGLQATFNPMKFAPEKWAKAAKEAGMKYIVFTTKHHDGFCMFETKETDYKITDSKTAFSSNTRSNVTKEIFNAFRNEGFLTGAYFSKADWHNENYWWPYFPPKDRNVNYDPKRYPERWSAFKDFTYNQIKELMTGYGKMDILWLDGGWVRPLSSIDTSISWQKGIKDDQDIDMKKIAAMARTYQPGLLIVDRTVPGEYENYTTPEQEVPDTPLSYPWETCMTMGGSWSYVPGDKYKSAQQLIDLLVKIVSRGGNFLLNVGPGPDGDWDPVVYDRMKELGIWIKINGEGIYNSKPMAPYSSDNIYYTQSKDERQFYAFYLSGTKKVDVPEQITLMKVLVKKESIISIAGLNARLKWKTENGNTIIYIPPSLAAKVNSQYAVVFKIQLPATK